MSPSPTHMASEIQEIPDAVERLLLGANGNAKAIGSALRTLSPEVVTTIARGSSDHAAAYLKYAIEISCGIPVSSTGPSVSSIYGTEFHLPRAASIAISQSGKSPDIVTMATAAGEGGAKVIALTNMQNSPLAEVSEFPFDILAGPEHSVAATKTFVSSIVAGLMILAEWKDDAALKKALAKLPEELSNALTCDWRHLTDRICAQQSSTGSLFVLGRGPAYAIAKECALKFKETCQLHAEAYSSAEVMHGPISIAHHGFPVLVLAARDAGEAGVVDIANGLTQRGVDVFITSDQSKAANLLAFARGSHPLTDPLVQVVSFYRFVEELARRLGLNPDDPPHLRKVTETV